MQNALLPLYSDLSVDVACCVMLIIHAVGNTTDGDRCGDIKIKVTLLTAVTVQASGCQHIYCTAHGLIVQCSQITRQFIQCRVQS